MPLRFKPLVIASLLLVLFLVLTASFSLIYFPARMREEADQVHQATDVAYAADVVRGALLTQDPMGALSRMTKGEQRFLLEEELQREVNYWFSQIDPGRLEADQKKIFLEARASVDHFFENLRQAESSGALDTRARNDFKGHFTEAYKSLRRFAEFSYRRVQQLQDREAYLDHVANLVGSVVGVTLMFGLLLILLASRNWVYIPLLTLRGVITRFADGDRSSRAPRLSLNELDSIGTAFNHMADRLAQLEQDRMRFLAGVAHDLKNPLTAIKSAGQLMEKRGEPANQLSRRILRMERMLEDLLDASSIQAGGGKFNLRRCDLRSVVSETVSMWTPVSRSHQFVLSQPELPLFVECDPQRIEQVLSNLISNAIKYSPSGGAITVSVGEKQGNAFVAVEDRGIGIAREEIKNLFEPFRRSPHVRDLIPGIGLGLAVSLRIMKAHQGTIEADSSPGKGSTFTLTLPLASPARRVA